jgi:hypothetical protein
MNPQEHEQFVQMVKVCSKSTALRCVEPSVLTLDWVLLGAQMQIHQCEMMVKQKPRSDEAFSMWGFGLLQLAVVEAEIEKKQVRKCPCTPPHDVRVRGKPGGALQGSSSPSEWDGSYSRSRPLRTTDTAGPVPGQAQPSRQDQPCFHVSGRLPHGPPALQRLLDELLVRGGGETHKHQEGPCRGTRPRWAEGEKAAFGREGLSVCHIVMYARMVILIVMSHELCEPCLVRTH